MKFITKHSFRARLNTAWNYIYEFADITDQRHIFLLSAGIAFNQLLCMIPLLILIISVVSGFIDEGQARETVELYLRQLLPQNIEATNTISTIVYELGTLFTYRSMAGWIAGGVLLWLSSALFSSMRTGLNAIFHIPTPKFFVWYRLKDLLLTVIVAALILMTTSASPILTVLEQYSTQFLDDQTGIVFGISAQIASVIATVVLFFVLYRFIPNRQLPWQIVVISTLFAVGFWELARGLFTWYVNTASTLSKFYGGYIVLASLALWFYYSSFIFLISAELAQFIYTRYKEHRSPEA